MTADTALREPPPEGWLDWCTGDRGAPLTDPGLTRRRLLLLGAATAASAVLWPGRNELASAAMADAPATDLLRRSRFLPCVGERFRLSAPGGPTILARLDAICDLSSPRAAAGAEDGFVLLFRGPATPRLDQDVLRVRHPALGTIELLVSPASTGRRGMDYAAVINRLRPT